MATAGDGGDDEVHTETSIAMVALNPPEAECHLLRMPAEIRNEIFYLALTADGDDESVDISSIQSGITFACKQIREETRAIYFGSYSYAAHIINLNEKPLVTWLKNIGKHRTRAVALLKIITQSQIVRVDPMLPGRKIGSCFPNHAFSTDIITHLKDAGLSASQVIWPSSLFAGIEANTWVSNKSFPIPAQLAVESTIFYHDILPDLLKRYDFYDPENPPVSVISKLIDAYGLDVADWIERHRDRSDSFNRRISRNHDPPWWAITEEHKRLWVERRMQAVALRQQAREAGARRRYGGRAGGNGV